MTLRMDAETRARQAALKRELAALERPVKKAQKAERKARAAERKEFAKRDFPGGGAKPKREKIDDGSDYMAWLHHDIPCIVCLLFGKHHLAPAPIEAAHQKVQRAERGYNRAAGRRGSHWTCVPLCAGHHRIGPLCCDPAQAKFWSVVGFDADGLIDFIEALNAAFREGRSGAAVVRRFAEIAADNRVRAA